MKVQNLFALLLFVIMGLGVVSCDKDDGLPTKFVTKFLSGDFII